MLTMYALQIIMFSDLECDYINPIDLCNKLNQVCLLQRFFFRKPLPSFLTILPSPVHASRNGRARRTHRLLPLERSMAGLHPQRAPRRLQRQQVSGTPFLRSVSLLTDACATLQSHEQKSHAGCDRNLPDTVAT